MPMNWQQQSKVAFCPRCNNPRTGLRVGHGRRMARSDLKVKVDIPTKPSRIAPKRATDGNLRQIDLRNDFTPSGYDKTEVVLCCSVSTDACSTTFTIPSS